MNIDLDIIIPCFNAKKTILNTLESIKIQKDVIGFKVYLINDKSDYDYREEIDNYSKYFYIEEIKLDKNMGPGGARREGINRTNSKYIMFIDSDDVLYDCYSIKDLYNASIGYDLCISNFIFERDGVRVVKEKNLVWLHGKVYRREFLDKYNIRFNDSRANEDNGFNRLIILMNPKINFYNRITYIYRDNADSITRKNNRSYKIFGLEGFIYNMKWAIDEALKRGADASVIPCLSTSILVSMYYDYLCYIDDDDSYNIIRYSKDIIPYYRNYGEIDNKTLNELFMYKEKDVDSIKKKYDKSISFEEFIKMVEEC